MKEKEINVFAMLSVYRTKKGISDIQYDIYEDEDSALDAFEAEVGSWRERHPDADTGIKDNTYASATGDEFLYLAVEKRPLLGAKRPKGENMPLYIPEFRKTDIPLPDIDGKKVEGECGYYIQFADGQVEVHGDENGDGYVFKSGKRFSELSDDEVAYISECELSPENGIDGERRTLEFIENVARATKKEMLSIAEAYVSSFTKGLTDEEVKRYAYFVSTYIYDELCTWACFDTYLEQYDFEENIEVWREWEQEHGKQVLN